MTVLFAVQKALGITTAFTGWVVTYTIPQSLCLVKCTYEGKEQHLDTVQVLHGTPRCH
jgi:hypothetical protein